MGVFIPSVKSIKKTGSTALKGDVTLSEGTGITLTQTGQDISIASAGGGGGQTLYDYVVAPTGGDYATLSACLAVAPAGSSIFVRSGSYSEAGGTFSQHNVTIVGENRKTTMLVLGAALTISGDNGFVTQLGFTSGTNTLTIGGSNSSINHCYFLPSGSGDSNTVTIAGAGVSFDDNVIDGNSSSGRVYANYYPGMSITNNVIKGYAASDGMIKCSAQYCRIENNYLQIEGGNGGYGFYVSGTNVSVTGNTMKAMNDANSTAGLFTGNDTTIANNTVQNLWIGFIASGTTQTYSGNTFHQTLDYSGSCCLKVEGSRIVISGNTFKGNTTDTAYRGVRVQGTGVIITGNIFYTLGQAVDSGSFEDIVITNNIWSSVTTPTNVSASNSVVANNLTKT